MVIIGTWNVVGRYLGRITGTELSSNSFIEAQWYIFDLVFFLGAGVDGAALLLGLQPVMAISSGSACSSAKTAPSHVLTALGRSQDLAYASVRFGIGRYNTEEEIDQVAAHFISTVSSLRKQSSLVK